MKRVLVGVKSIQRDADGQDTVIEMVSPGEYHEKTIQNILCIMKLNYPVWKGHTQQLS